GDFFRCIWLGEAEERFAIALGDVSGKGMKAAWTAAMADGMLHAEAKLWWFSTGQILTELNRGLYERKTDEITYVVFCFASVYIREKTLQFSNSGLPWPLMKSEGELITIAESSGFPLGMMRDTVYGDRYITLKAGDTIVFYTDGITEAMNQRDEMYTTERLENILREADPELSADQLVDEIFRDAESFTGGAPQFDDMTVVVLKVNGREEVI
ncbi:PP2C family protein-serine/threonine phosphatase, partial [Candidatus Poribacteria bacterium]